MPEINFYWLLWKRKGFKGTEYELRIQKYIQIFIWPKMIFFFRIGKGTTMNVSAENSHISFFRFLRGPHTVYNFQNWMGKMTGG